jgi:hypothetical protein
MPLIHILRPERLMCVVCVVLRVMSHTCQAMPKHAQESLRENAIANKNNYLCIGTQCSGTDIIISCAKDYCTAEHLTSQTVAKSCEVASICYAC